MRVCMGACCMEQVHTYGMHNRDQVNVYVGVVPFVISYPSPKMEVVQGVIL